MIKELVLPLIPPAVIATGYSMPRYLEGNQNLMALSFSLMVAGILLSKRSESV